MPAVMSDSDPSSCRTCMAPETMTPTWCAWQESVPATGLMHSDHFQPGCTVSRAALMPARSTTSTFVLSGERTSSGDSKLLAIRPAMGFLLEWMTHVPSLAAGSLLHDRAV